MNVKIAVLLALLGGLLLGGCAASQKAAKPGEPPADPVTVRLPVGTPLKIEQEVPPPAGEQSIAPVDVQEGKAHSLKLFQIDLGHVKASPAAAEEPPGLPSPSESDTSE
ncbi:MAG: hypothetical protein IH611_12810 [Deltaproteobacteria bacterium]|nr:hypothetical protein [Deltaproteobacteria bacterium]